MKDFLHSPFGLFCVTWFAVVLLAGAFAFVGFVNAGDVDQNGRWIKPKKSKSKIVQIDFNGLLFCGFILLVVYFVLKLNGGN